MFMHDLALLGYVFGAFLVGVLCLGAAFVIGLRRDDRLARAFLLFYLPFSLLVMTMLVMVFTEVVAPLPPWVLALTEYLESFPGRYALMLALPLFAHRVYGVQEPRRDRVVVIVVVSAFGLQHVTEFLLGGAWDPRGDVAEDLLFALLVGYTLVLAIRHRGEDGVYRPLARRFFLLLLLWIPGTVHDVFLVDGPGFRLYPLWYSLLGVVLVVTLVRRSFVVGEELPADWTLTARESEVVRLVSQGLTNRQIAGQLIISENTVKTHLRSVFDKTGYRNRIALVAALKSRPGADAIASGVGESGPV